MHICTLATDDYVPGTLALGQSLHENSGFENIQLHILTPNNITPENKQRILDLPVSISIWDEDWLVEYNFDRGLIPKSKEINQFKFNVFRLPVDKVLFLDSDIICLNNIKEIKSMSEFTAGLNIGQEHIEMVNNMPVFNTGCFICEPSKDKFADIKEFGAQWNDKINKGDQPIINRFYLKNHPETVNYLDMHWNVAMTCYKHRPYFWQEMMSRGIKFLHYTDFKPWSQVFPTKRDELHCMKNIRSRFLDYRKLVSWWQPYYKRATQSG